MKNLNLRNWGRADILPVSFWLGIFILTYTFMHGADHFLQLTPEALGKYFRFRWILIGHITAGGGALALALYNSGNGFNKTTGKYIVSLVSYTCWQF